MTTPPQDARGPLRERKGPPQGRTAGSPARWLPLAAVLGLVATAALGPILAGLLRSHGDGLMPQCMILNSTGLYCPGCGGTRSILALLERDLATAARYNALFVFGGAGLLVLAALGWWRRGRVPAWAHLILLCVVCTVMLLFAVLRNLPAFTFLAPP